MTSPKDLRAAQRRADSGAGDRGFRSLFDAHPDAWLLAVDGVVRHANDAMQALIAPGGHSLVGTTLLDLMTSDGRRAMSSSLDRLAHGAVAADSIEIDWCSPDGSSVATEVSVGTVRWQGHDAVQLTARDLTERHQTEATISRVGADMFERLEAGSVELAESNQHLLAEVDRRERAEAHRNSVLAKLALAQEDERSRLSRELHDGAGQHLTALLLGLRELVDITPMGSETDRRASALHALAERLGAELHDVAVRLRPRALDDFGVEVAIKSYATDWSQRSGIAVEVHAVPGHHRLPSAIETAMYRITQEALTNIARHSGATHASIVLDHQGGMCRLVIEDDGRGFDSDAMSPGGPSSHDGIGLLGMRERAHLLSGVVEVESAIDAGTSVFVRIPLATESHA